MANTYKDIVITPFRGDANNDPVIKFSTGDATSNLDMNVRFYPLSNGSLSFEGTAGQLFSITNDLTGTIFSVNDVSGIPSIEVNASGLIKLGEFGGNVAVGRSNADYKLDVVGTINASNILINGAIITNQGIGANAWTNTVFGFSNTYTAAAFVQANTARTHANAAFGQANTATTNAGNAFGQANTARTHANAAFGKANSALANTTSTFEGSLTIKNSLTTTSNVVTFGTSMKIESNGDVVIFGTLNMLD